MTVQERYECNGGQGCCIYKIKDTIQSFDKGSHKLRSLFNQPNHAKHKEKNKKMARGVGRNNSSANNDGNLDNFNTF